MSNLFYLIIISFNFILIGCSNSKNDLFLSDYNFPYEMYIKSQKNLKNKKYSQAINILEKIYQEYYFSDYHELVELDLVYAYYKNHNFLLCKSLINQFIQKHPNYLNMDYLIYIRGIINTSINGTKIQKFLRINLFDRDIVYIKEAFEDFSKIILQYKNSKYLSDSKKRLIFIKNILAKYDLEVSNFYFNKQSYIAVINRVNHMLKHYPESKETFLALRLIELSYRKLFLFEEADKISKVINNNKN